MKNCMLVFALLLMCSATWAASVPVPNGSFESPTLEPPETMRWYPDISPWYSNLPYATFAFVYTSAANNPAPTDGNQAVAFSRSGIYWSPEMAMTAGDTVTFTFDLANAGWDMESDKYARAWLSENADGSGATYTLDPENQYESIVITPDEIPYFGWKTYTISDVVPQAQAGWYLNFRVYEYYGWIAMDNVRLDISGFGSIVGNIELKDYTGAADLAPVLVDLRPVQGGAAKQAKVFSGSYRIDDVLEGTYDVAFVACKWLQRVVTGVQVTRDGEAPASVSLPNGDLDGDGGVTSTDLSVVLKNK